MVGSEQIAEELAPLDRVRLEQLAEFPLGDHGHLFELLPAQGQQLLQGFLDVSVC